LASDSTGWIKVLPFYGFGFLIVLTDVAHEFVVQVLDRCENPSRDDIALDLGEPQFYLIEPGGIRRGKMQMNVGMTSEEFLDLRGFVRGEIIGYLIVAIEICVQRRYPFKRPTHALLIILELFYRAFDTATIVTSRWFR